MLKLSMMNKIVKTVDENWRSAIAETILTRWGYDEGSVYYYRGSANFIFVFKRDGKRYFLRFNHSSERNFDEIHDELRIVNYLHEHGVKVALPEISRHNQLIESVDTDHGLFYSVVFEALEGNHWDIENLKEEDYYSWGRALGRLHHIFKTMPDEFTLHRKSWFDQVEHIQPYLTSNEKEGLRVLVEKMKAIPVSNENYGSIHFDFELDNIIWNNNEVSILDFDDCSRNWYVADIVYALRDLEKLEGRMFDSFIEGYKHETALDERVLKHIEIFKVFHHYFALARLVRSVDIDEKDLVNDSLRGLRKKLLLYIQSYRENIDENTEIL
ncbi:phosphotransferase enzyme family protein [Bacillus salitolerans]|uniref:Phosphotransferase enzyme family protein n=1 Tax=Bacillus salitolerans TaxID=1437434 RepID=A0ABW4LRG1_9BACI